MIYKRKKEQGISCSFKKVPFDQKERQCEKHQPDQQIAEHDRKVKARDDDQGDSREHIDSRTNDDAHFGRDTFESFDCLLKQ